MKNAVLSATHQHRFAPSLVHDRLASECQPELAYRGERGADFEAWQAALRERLHELLGMRHHAGPRVPLNPRVLWKRDHPLGTIEKIVFTSELDADIPAYICLPRKRVSPSTWFICLQGHTSGMHNSISVEQGDETRPLEVIWDRNFGIGCMERGIAALCLEQRSFGERRETLRPEPPGSVSPCHQAATNALFFGRSLLGGRVFDVDRAIDYLEQRDDCDPGGIGVMGNSGGGTTSLFAAGLLPRIRFAMASCCFCSFEKSILSMVHCVCNYVPGLALAAEMGDIAGLVAPRPLIVVNGDADEIFPIDGAREEFLRVQQMYAASGASNACRHVVCPGGHRFYAEASWRAFFEMR